MRLRLLVLTCATVLLFPARSDAATISTGINMNGTDGITVTGHDDGLRDPDQSGVVDSVRYAHPDLPPEIQSYLDWVKTLPPNATYCPAPLEVMQRTGICNPPAQGGPPVDPPQVIAERFSLDYLRHVPLPRPRIDISAPNGGITGAVHSLDLHMRPEVLYSDPDTPFGAMHMYVTGTITVDWGDGTKTVTTDAGGPYPSSTLTHTWTTSSHYDIAATVAWSARWTLGPYLGRTYSGTLSTTTAADPLRAYPVMEAQAVITG